MPHTTDPAGFDMQWETSAAATGETTITLSLPRDLRIDDTLDLYVLQRREGQWYAASETINKYFGLPYHPYDPPFVMGDFAAETKDRRVREEVLDQAKSLVVGDRNAQYGEPYDDFLKVADALNAYGYSGPGGRKIMPRDIPFFQVLVKLSRIVQSPTKMDSWIDLAGYAACGAEVADVEDTKAVQDAE